MWHSRINYTDVTCQWSTEPFVRDFVVDRQSGFLGNGTEFYSMQNFESTPLEIRTNKTVEGNSESSRSSGNHVSCIGLVFRLLEHSVKLANLVLYERLPLPPQSLQADALELTIRTIYSHTNNTLPFEPNLPHWSNVIRLPKQETIDYYYHNYLTKLLPKYRLRVSVYKSYHHLSNMWVST